MIEVEINKIRIDESRAEQVLILKEKEGARYLPLVIGMAEMQAIHWKLKKVKPPRPMTHDLIINLIKTLNAKVVKILIDEIKSSTFYAKLVIKDVSGKVIKIDARPSDSLAVAIRVGVPIFVLDEVLENGALADI